MDDLLRLAKSCRHYAMCKIDFLGSGVCASGTARHYVSFYPQGRMDLYAALKEGLVPVTEKAVEIAATCDLCGKCDYQCYFVTEMRPTRVMRALKEHVESFVNAGGRPEPAEEDELLQQMRHIVGAEWATNDRAIALTYAHDPCPIAAGRMPGYVVMPATRAEIQALLRLFHQRHVPWVARGNGSSDMGLVMSEGVVIDVNRMKEITFDEKKWVARVGAGISAFELQREAASRGYRVNVAEPAALVCSNLVGTGIFSTFMAAYGTAGNNFVDAEFVAPDGGTFSLSQKSGPNLFAFHSADVASPGVCTSANVKLHPLTSDEAGVLVPFTSLGEALGFVKELSVRRIGLAVGVLGPEYVSAFIAPTKDLAKRARKAFVQDLDMAFLVLVIGDRYALRAVADMGHPLIDQRLFRTLNLGLAALKDASWAGLLGGLSDQEPFAYLKVDGFADLAEAALAPSPAALAAEIDADLRGFFEQVYARSEMTDLVWLNTFRIVSSRMGRAGHFLIFIVYLPLETPLIEELSARFRVIAERHGVRNDLGFVSPIDEGKRALLEYDYFFDQTDPEQIARVQQAASEAAGVIEDYSARLGTLRWIRHVVNQGICRQENLLYT